MCKACDNDRAQPDAKEVCKWVRGKVVPWFCRAPGYVVSATGAKLLAELAKQSRRLSKQPPFNFGGFQ